MSRRLGPWEGGNWLALSEDPEPDYKAHQDFPPEGLPGREPKLEGADVPQVIPKRKKSLSPLGSGRTAQPGQNADLSPIAVAGYSY